MELRLFGRRIYVPLNGLNVSRRLEYAQLLRYLDLNGRELVLDVACGDGYWTAKIAARAAAVAGFDCNFERLKQAQKRSAVAPGFVRCDAHYLPFKSAIFDRAIGICVLEHFDDDRAALQELRRVLKTGATLALSVDSFSYPGITEAEKSRHARKFSVRQFYDFAELREKLQGTGFEVLAKTYLLKSPLAAALYRQALRSPRLAYLLFPFSYLLSLCSERLAQKNRGGYKLAVAARAR